jgi:hypothetical protein
LSVSTNIKIFIGDNDKFIKKEKLKETLELLDENKLRYELINYTGGHEMISELMAPFFK